MDLQILKQLDYGVYSNVDRAALVNKIVDDNVITTLEEYYSNKGLGVSTSVTKQLEGAANYILYGKDPKTEKNEVQKKNVQIEGKHNSYKKKQPESLDALLQNPMFDQKEIKPIKRNTYTKPKQTIIRPYTNKEGICTNAKTHHGDIPGMKEVWITIDRMQYILDVNNGKIEEEEGRPAVPVLDNITKYKWKHTLIDIRRHQYYLKDSAHPPCFTMGTTFNAPAAIDWESDSFVDKYGKPAPRLQLNNPDHVYHLLENYSLLRQSSEANLNGQMKYIMWSLDETIKRAPLAPPRMQILIRKIDKWTNERIQHELRMMFGLAYSVNYISTIWKQEICMKIAVTADLIYDEWLFRQSNNKWKNCSSCGKKKLKDTRNFVKKTTNHDGLSNQCKVCDKKHREEKKK
jgi:hypothetical protein